MDERLVRVKGSWLGVNDVKLNPIFDSEVAMRKALTALRDIRKVTLANVPVAKTATRKGWSVAARKAHWVNLNPTVGAEMQKVRPCVVVSP